MTPTKKLSLTFLACAGLTLAGCGGELSRPLPAGYADAGDDSGQPADQVNALALPTCSQIDGISGVYAYYFSAPAQGYPSQSGMVVINNACKTGGSPGTAYATWYGWYPGGMMIPSSYTQFQYWGDYTNHMNDKAQFQLYPLQYDLYWGAIYTEGGNSAGYCLRQFSNKFICPIHFYNKQGVYTASGYATLTKN